jgi:hypothetical protein
VEIHRLIFYMALVRCSRADNGARVLVDSEFKSTCGEVIRRSLSSVAVVDETGHQCNVVHGQLIETDAERESLASGHANTQFECDKAGSSIGVHSAHVAGF